MRDSEPIPSEPPTQRETLADMRWFEVEGKDCLITIEPRPMYCDRGHWIAKLHPKPGALPGDFDGSDGWPRYFFDWQRMIDEIAAWLDWRKQRV